MEKVEYKPGFAGYDAMREKAKRIFDGEMRTTKMEMPMSASAPSKTPMRKYKKGGSVRAMPHDNALGLKKGGRAMSRKCMNKGGSAYEEQSSRYTHPSKHMGAFHDREDNTLRLNKGGCVTAKVNNNALKLKKGGSAKKTSVLRQAMKGRTKNKESMAVMDARMDREKKPISPKMKMAAGGVAKIRHGVATKEGLPINRKVVKGK